MREHAAKVQPESACEPVELGSHEQYLEYLDLIESDTEKIVIVQIDGADNADPIVKRAEKSMCLQSRRRTNDWYGTITLGKQGMEYTFLKSNEFFEYLRSLEAFYIETSAVPYTFRLTDFGTDDIAFVDKNDNLLFYTTTHEGDAYLNRIYLR